MSRSSWSDSRKALMDRWWAGTPITAGRDDVRIPVASVCVLREKQAKERDVKTEVVMGWRGYSGCYRIYVTRIVSAGSNTERGWTTPTKKGDGQYRVVLARFRNLSAEVEDC